MGLPLFFFFFQLFYYKIFMKVEKNMDYMPFLVVCKFYFLPDIITLLFRSPSFIIIIINPSFQQQLLQPKISNHTKYTIQYHPQTKVDRVQIKHKKLLSLFHIEHKCTTINIHIKIRNIHSLNK